MYHSVSALHENIFSVFWITVVIAYTLEHHTELIKELQLQTEREKSCAEEKSVVDLEESPSAESVGMGTVST